MSQKNMNWFDNVEARQHPWPGLNWLTTALNVKNVRDAVEFYSSAMGFVPIFELPDESGQLLFARMRYRGCNFTLNREGFDSNAQSPADTGNATPFSFYLYVDNAADTASKAISLGATEVFAVREEFWGDLRARVRDPFGYVWDFAQAPAIPRS